MCLSNLYAAHAATEQGKYTDKVAKINATIQERAAHDARQRGELDADQYRLQTKGLIGTQRASFAANGIDVNSGSAGHIQDDTGMYGELDALTIANNAAREAYGYQVQAMDTRQQGRIARWQGNVQATASILGGIEKAASFATMGAGGGGGGLNLQGQAKPLYNNPAYVRRM